MPSLCEDRKKVKLILENIRRTDFRLSFIKRLFFSELQTYNAIKQKKAAGLPVGHLSINVWINKLVAALSFTVIDFFANQLALK